MVRIARFASVMLLSTILVSAGCGRPDTPVQRPSLSVGAVESTRVEAELQSMIPGLLEKARIAGLSVCLIRDNRLAWSDGFGFTDAEEPAPVVTTTVFQAASLSKPVFAYTVLRLADRGEIDLDTPLVEYVDVETAQADYLGDAFEDDRISKITARMVLTHTTGLPNWRGEAGLEFLFDPGERFGYSGEAYGLLQKVVERITGSDLEELAQTLTFGPLGMENSTFIPSPPDLESYAWPHDGTGAREPVPGNLDRLREAFGAHAAASLLTTAPDYARFLVALMTGVGLEDATHADLLAAQVMVGEETSVAWGLGAGFELSPEGPRPWHWGDNGNSKAFFMVDPGNDAGIVYFANAFNGLSIVGDVLETAMPGDHPVLECALMEDYPSHDSPGFRTGTPPS